MNNNSVPTCMSCTNNCENAGKVSNCTCWKHPSISKDNKEEAKISKEKPMNCSECEYLKESTSEEPMRAECGITKEQLNPFEVCYSTGIGKRCPFEQDELPY